MHTEKKYYPNVQIHPQNQAHQLLAELSHRHRKLTPLEAEDAVGAGLVHEKGAEVGHVHEEEVEVALAHEELGVDLAHEEVGVDLAHEEEVGVGLVHDEASLLLEDVVREVALHINVIIPHLDGADLRQEDTVLREGAVLPQEGTTRRPVGAGLRQGDVPHREEAGLHEGGAPLREDLVLLHLIATERRSVFKRL